MRKLGRWLPLLMAAALAGCTDRQPVATAPRQAAAKPAASAGNWGQIQYFGYVAGPNDAMLAGTSSYTNWGWFATDATPASTAVSARINSQAAYGLRTIVEMGNLLWCGTGQRELCPGWKTRLSDWVGANDTALHSGNVLAFSIRDEPFWLQVNIAQVDSAAKEVKRLFPTVPILLIESSAALQSSDPSTWWNTYKSQLTTVDWICTDLYSVDPLNSAPFDTALGKLRGQYQNARTVYAGDGYFAPGEQAVAFGPNPDTMAWVINRWYQKAAADPAAILLGVVAWDSLDGGPGSRDLGPRVLQAQTAIGRAITGRARSQSYAPLGVFQSLSGNTASGWACDPDGAWGETVQVDFYSDGAWVGSTTANRPTTLAATPGCRSGTYHGFQAQLSRVGRNTTAVIRDLDVGSTTVQAPATVTVAWVKPSYASWGPANTLTAAGLTTNGSGSVQLVWRDATVNGPWNYVAYQAPLASDGSWSNTIPTSNYCHDYQVFATYSGATSATYYYNGLYAGYCNEQARIIWIQPQSTAGFGPVGSLVVAGSATGAPSGTLVTMFWRDVTAGQYWWTQEPFAAPTDANGIWYNSIANANPYHQYAVYVRYDVKNSATCTYEGTNGPTNC